MDDRKIRVAITQGDTNGVGYELIFKTFAEPEMLELCTPIVYGSPKVAAYHRKALDIQANFTIISDASEAHEGKINLLTCFDEDVKVDLGMPTPESGTAALKALDRAMTDFRNGAFDVLVSAPFDAASIHDEMFRFPSLAKYVETSVGDGRKALTIMVNDSMCVAVETEGRDIRDVACSISQEGIEATVRQLAESARRDFRCSNPRVAVLALNAGADGSEEHDIIAPAVEKLAGEGVVAFGPYSADDLFGTRKYEAFDMILAMYDGQGLVPFLTLAPEEGVRFIANLPIVCAEPMSTPQYEIAGRGIADEMAFRHAVFTVIDVYRNRQSFDEPYAHPLQKLYHEKRDESDKVRFAIPKKRESDGRQDGRPARQGGQRDDRQRDSRAAAGGKGAATHDDKAAAATAPDHAQTAPQSAAPAAAAQETAASAPQE